MNNDKDRPSNTLSDKKDTTSTMTFKNQLKTWLDVGRYSDVFKNFKVGEQFKG